MNPASQHLEGKLLDYAYGELSEGEAKTVEAHLSACPECADSLTAMKQVRRTMAQLPIAEAPQAGLESLLAYAHKAAETARARPARRQTWLRWIVPIGSVAALALVLVLSVNVMRRPVATVAFKPDDTRGDWEGVRSFSVKKEAETAEKTAVASASEQKVAREDEAPAKARAQEAEPASQWARAQKSAGAPVASEPAASPPAERLAQQTKGTPAAGEGDGVRKVKVFAAPKPARRAAAPSDHGDAREEVESGVAGGVVGGVVAAGDVLSGPPAAKPMGDTVAGGTAEQLAQANSAGERQQAPAKVASQHAEGSAEAKQTLKALGSRSSTPSSPAAEPPIDREREVAQLRQALATAQGQERARLLRRLCEVLDALGRRGEADSACDAVVREFPASEEAKSALERLKVRAAEQRDKSESAPHP
jgi:hypothetical protein